MSIFGAATAGIGAYLQNQSFRKLTGKILLDTATYTKVKNALQTTEMKDAWAQLMPMFKSEQNDDKIKNNPES